MGKRKQSSEVGGQGSATTATQSKPTEVDERPALMRGIDTSSDKPYWEVGTENGGQSSSFQSGLRVFQEALGWFYGRGPRVRSRQ